MGKRNEQGQFVSETGGAVGVQDPPTDKLEQAADTGRQLEFMTPELEARLRSMGWVSPSQQPVHQPPSQAPYVGADMLDGEDIDPEDIIPDQPPPVYIPGDLMEKLYVPSDVIEAREEDANKSHLDELKFQNEPVMIYIHPQPTEHPDRCVPCFVNAMPGEVWDEGIHRWLAIGFFPIERNIITRRKYVEVIGRARIENVTNEITYRPDKHTLNNLKRRQGARWPFSIRMDWNKGRRAQSWYRTMFAQRY
jgi:hypothetical protein